MKALLFLLLLSSSAAAQCAKPEDLTEWNDKTQAFNNCHPGGSSGEFGPKGAPGALPVDHGAPGMDYAFTSEQDHKEFCNSAFIVLIKLCPLGQTGKTCRANADGIRARCLGQKSASDGNASTSVGGINPCSAPSGGSGGSPFADRAQTITGINVRSGTMIDAIGLIGGDNHGGAGGSPATFMLNPGESIQSIHGKTGQFVDSIVIATNQGRSVSFGGQGGGQSYSFVAPPGYVIGGFCGRSGQMIDAIAAVWFPTHNQ